MKIGNIVSKNEIDVEDCLNKFKTIDEVDNNLPTLIVGWKQMTKDFPNQPILRKEIYENLTWCFSKFEDRTKFSIDYEKFIQSSFDKLISKYPLIYIDCISFPLKKIKKIIGKIKNSENIITYYNDNDIIIFADDIIFSVNINVLLFLNIHVDNFKTKLNNITNNTLPNKKSNDLLIKYSERIYEDITYLPLLYSLSKK